MGEVYLAEDTGLKRQVALKRIAPRLCKTVPVTTQSSKAAMVGQTPPPSGTLVIEK